jgi:hypothetical protein
MRYAFVGDVDGEALASRIAASPLAGRIFFEDHEEQWVLELRGATLDEAQAFAAAAGGVLRDEAELLAALSDLTDVFRARAALLELGALWHSDLRLLELLRELGVNPRTELRAGVIALASRIGYRLFLLEMWARETDPVLRRILRSATSFPEDIEK